VPRARVKVASEHVLGYRSDMRDFVVPDPSKQLDVHAAIARLPHLVDMLKKR
jgi:hypothetical protein